MAKIHEHKVGDLRCVLYQYKLGYAYKIYLGKYCVARNYTYMKSKDDCYNKMCDEANTFIGMTDTLLERLER